MGNDQSRAHGQQEQQQVKPPNYYELLEVEEEATEDEIKVCDVQVCHSLRLNAETRVINTPASFPESSSEWAKYCASGIALTSLQWPNSTAQASP
jgi:hypothetical protein